MWLTTNTKSLQVSKSCNCNARFTDASTLQLSLELGALSLTHPKVSSRTHWDLKSTQTDGSGNDHTHSHCTWYISSFDHPMSLEELLSLKNKTKMNLKNEIPTKYVIFTPGYNTVHGYITFPENLKLDTYTRTHLQQCPPWKAHLRNWIDASPNQQVVMLLIATIAPVHILLMPSLLHIALSVELDKTWSHFQ